MGPAICVYAWDVGGASWMFFRSARSYKVAVDYDRSIRQSLDAAKFIGKQQGTVVESPSKHSGKSRIEVRLMRPSYTPSYNGSPDFLADDLNRQGLRPLETREFLAFAEQYPTLGRKHPVIDVASLVYVGGDLYLVSCWEDDDFSMLSPNDCGGRMPLRTRPCTIRLFQNGPRTQNPS